MLCSVGSARGGSLSKGEDGLYPLFPVPLPVAPLAQLGNPRPWLFVGCKGIPVCCFSWDVESPKAVVVLVHGYGSHCMYEWLQPVIPEPAPEEPAPEPSPEEQTSEAEPKAIAKALTSELKSMASVHEEVESSWNCCKPAVSADTPEATRLLKAGSIKESLSRKSMVGLYTGPEKAESLKMSFSLRSGTKLLEVPEVISVEQVVSVEPPPLNEKTPDEPPTPKLTYTGSWVQRFVSQGWRVVGMDLQSHGASHGWDGTSCQVQSFDDFAQDINTLLQSLANESPLPIFLVGISMGGCAAVRAAELLCKGGMLGKPHTDTPKEDEEDRQKQADGDDKQKQTDEEKQQEAGEKQQEQTDEKKQQQTDEDKQEQTDEEKQQQTDDEKQRQADEDKQQQINEGEKQQQTDEDGKKQQADEDGKKQHANVKQQQADVKPMEKRLLEDCVALSECTGSTATTARGTLVGRYTLTELRQEGAGAETEKTHLADNSADATENVPEVEYRVVRQNPVPLAGLILLSPLLEGPVPEQSLATCLALPFKDFLRSWFPHCEVASRPQNELFPDIESLFNSDKDTFKGKCRVNIGLEMQEGVKAAQADAHWLRRPILRDAKEPASIADWVKLLHRNMAKSEARERKALRDAEKQGAQPTTQEQHIPRRQKKKGGTAKDTTEENAQHISVLVIQSFDDTNVPPLGSVRFFKKLGGKATVPEPWASVLREEKRKEREAKLAAKGDITDDSETEDTEEETGGESSDSEVVPAPSFKEECFAKEGDLGLKARLRITESVDKSGSTESHRKPVEELPPVEPPALALGKATTLDKYAAKAEFLMAQGIMKAAAAKGSAFPIPSDSVEAPAKVPLKESQLKPEAKEDEAAGEVEATEEVQERPLAVNFLAEFENEQQKKPAGDERQRTQGSSFGGCCSCWTAAEEPPARTRKQRRRKQRGSQGAGGLVGSCSASNGKGTAGQQKKCRLYQKRKKWGNILGVVKDEHGCLVDVNNVNLIMDEVRAHGFEPFPELPSSSTEDSAKEEEEKQDPALDELEDKPITKIINTSADGALQLWLLKGKCHMLTKEPGNEELQADIISKFIQPTIQRLAVDTATPTEKTEEETEEQSA